MNIQDYIEAIQRNYNAAKNTLVNNPQACAGALRSALEVSVKLFWVKTYDKEPVWIIQGQEKFSLLRATQDDKFTSHFNKMTLSYMHGIRQTCDEILHQGKSLSVDLAQELFENLVKCIKAIQEEIGENLIVDIQKALQPIIETKAVSNTKPKAKGAEAEQDTFYKMLERAVAEGGNPFIFAHRAHYATINRKSPNCNLCLSLDFLVSFGFLRIGIYIQNDQITPHFNRLWAQKGRIEEKLGFVPLWTTKGQKNPNTRRIETHLPFHPYNHDDYERLIKQAIPVIQKYIEVFSVYLPEAFPDEKSFKDKIILPNPLIRDINKSWGTNAQEIYDAGCETFRWDKSERHRFGIMQILYAERATPEGYSPWVLPHNNWSKTTGGNWFNFINKDGTVIEELWMEQKRGLYFDYTTRVTFVKKGGQYIFLGVFEPVEEELEKMSRKLKVNIEKDGKIIKKAGETVWVKTYKLISNQYPL